MRSSTSMALVALLGSAATAAPAAPLQPVEAWNVDYGTSQCMAGRTFGDAVHPITLGFVPSITPTTYKLFVNVPETGPKYAQELRGTIDLGQGATPAWLIYFGGAGVPLSAYQTLLSGAQIQQLRSAQSLTISAGRSQYQFPVADVGAVLTALAKCTADLQKYWNLTAPPSVPAQTSQRSLQSLFTRAEYPTEAINKHQEGATQYQLLVDENGDLAGCDVLKPSGYPVLDFTGCDVIKQKAKFTPARDAERRAVRSVITTPLLNWKPEGSAFEGGCSTITTSGLLNQCQQERSRGPAPELKETAPPPPPPPPAH